MTIALLHKHYDQDQLDQVISEMIELGAPEIKAVWLEAYQMYAALEGCHRIRAAKELGITPVIIDIDYSDEMMSTVVDIDEFGEDYQISEICDDATSSEIIEF